MAASGEGEGDGTSRNETMGGDAVGAICTRLVTLFIHRVERTCIHCILSFVCIATDLRSSDGRPVTLDRREEGPIIGYLFELGILYV